jgi:hypothetical protein
MKKKYRIKEYTNGLGHKWFKVQERWLLLWISMETTYSSYDKAVKAIADIRAVEILESITHKVD